jgi:hypothetical protein
MELKYQVKEKKIFMGAALLLVSRLARPRARVMESAEESWRNIDLASLSIKASTADVQNHQNHFQ